MALPALALGALIGGGVGGLKHFLVDKPQADKERQYQAETARWSPWTGIQSKYVQNPSLFGGMLQGGMAGAAFGQGIDAMGGGTSSYSGLLEAPPTSQLGSNFDLSSGVNQMGYRFPFLRG